MQPIVLTHSLQTSVYWPERQLLRTDDNTLILTRSSHRPVQLCILLSAVSFHLSTPTLVLVLIHCSAHARRPLSCSDADADIFILWQSGGRKALLSSALGIRTAKIMYVVLCP